MSVTQRCGNCRFYDCRVAGPPPPTVKADCLRFPPIGGTNHYTYPNDWCGEWRWNDNEAAAQWKAYGNYSRFLELPPKPTRPVLNPPKVAS